MIASLSRKCGSVRIRGPPPASIFCHQIDPGRASKQHTAGDRVTKASARPYGKFRRILSGRIAICEACRNVFQRSRHIDASGAGDRGGCGVASIACRQVQYRSRRAGETRGKTSRAAATIPETERILRRDSCRNSRFAGAGAAALGPFRLRGPDFPEQDDVASSCSGHSRASQFSLKRDITSL